MDKIKEERPEIIVLAGPTACGKTALSLELAELFDCEIVSADSMQVYKGMDIGSAKQPYGERKGIPHHLIDIVEPDHPFSVSDFRERASVAIDDIINRGKVPLICGGTGLYIASLVSPCNFGDKEAADPAVRKVLQKEWEEKGGEELHHRLAEVDPEAAFKIHPNDSRRLLRALEVYEITGKTITSLRNNNRPPLYRAFMLGLTAERSLLYLRIEQRVDQMLEQGLLKEVGALLDKGISTDAVSMQGLGYRQMAAYLEQRLTFDEAVAAIKQETRRFAKRQMTWFKRDERIHWLQLESYPDIAALADRAAELISEFFPIKQHG